MLTQLTTSIKNKTQIDQPAATIKIHWFTTEVVCHDTFGSLNHRNLLFMFTHILGTLAFKLDSGSLKKFYFNFGKWNLIKRMKHHENNPENSLAPIKYDDILHRHMKKYVCSNVFFHSNIY